MMSQNNPKKPAASYSNDSVLEALRDLGGDVGQAVGHDVVAKAGQAALSSIVGAPRSGELNPNQTVELTGQRLEPRTSGAEFNRAPIRREEADLSRKIEEVRRELAALAATVSNLHQDIDKAVSEVPVEPGVYHLNFFERLKSLLKALKEQIEDSRSWLALWSTRKKQRHYWSLYRKHGTKFGLSSERTLATQAG